MIKSINKRVPLLVGIGHTAAHHAHVAAGNLYDCLKNDRIADRIYQVRPVIP